MDAVIFGSSACRYRKELERSEAALATAQAKAQEHAQEGLTATHGPLPFNASLNPLQVRSRSLCDVSYAINVRCCTVACTTVRLVRKCMFDMVHLLCRCIYRRRRRGSRHCASVRSSYVIYSTSAISRRTRSVTSSSLALLAQYRGRNQRNSCFKMFSQSNIQCDLCCVAESAEDRPARRAVLAQVDTRRLPPRQGLHRRR